MPHEYVPWTEGRNFAGVFEDGVPWDVEQSKVDRDRPDRLVVNLLTEDNLPSYHREIAELFGRDGAWGTWVHRWTAEEGRHGIAIRDYLLATRAVDPDAARARAHGAHGEGFERQPRRHAARARVRRLPGARHPRLAPQHRQATRRTRSPTSCWPGSRSTRTCTWSSTATCSAAALEIAPDQTMQAIRDVVETLRDARARRSRASPAGRRRSRSAGIYDLRIHRDEVLNPVLRHWKVLELEGLDPEGEQAREELAASWTSSTRRPPASRRSAPRSRPGRRPAPTRREGRAGPGGGADLARGARPPAPGTRPDRPGVRTAARRAVAGPGGAHVPVALLPPVPRRLRRDARTAT